MGNILAPFKKFLSNKNTITILGVLLGVVVLFLGYKWRVNEAINPQEVYYAARTLIQGETIKAEDVQTTTISNSNLNSMSNIVRTLTCPEGDLSKDCIVGKMVSFDAKIPVNSYFFRESLINPNDMPDSIFSNIPDGYTIFALKVDNDSTLGNSIFPDDTIDLYLYVRSSKDDSENRLIYGKFIKQIQVLAVKDSNGNNVFRNRDDLSQPDQLLFSVPEDLYLLLKKAQYLGDTVIVPVARNTSYSTNPGETEVESGYLKDYILQQTVQIPDENVVQTTSTASSNEDE